MIEFTQEEVASAYRIAGLEPPATELKPAPSAAQLEQHGIDGYEVDGVSYDVDMLALLSLVSPELEKKVDRYLAERGWDIPEVIERLDASKRRLKRLRR